MKGKKKNVKLAFMTDDIICVINILKKTIEHLEKMKKEEKANDSIITKYEMFIDYCNVLIGFYELFPLQLDQKK